MDPAHMLIHTALADYLVDWKKETVNFLQLILLEVYTGIYYIKSLTIYWTISISSMHPSHYAGGISIQATLQLMQYGMHCIII